MRTLLVALLVAATGADPTFGITFDAADIKGRAWPSTDGKYKLSSSVLVPKRSDGGGAYVELGGQTEASRTLFGNPPNAIENGWTKGVFFLYDPRFLLIVLCTTPKGSSF